MLEITDDTFDTEVLNSDIPVLVDFWATWCGPCRAVAPQVAKLAEELDGQVKIVKIEMQDGPGAFKNFGVQGIPTFVMFNGGQEVDRFVGSHLPKVREMIDATLAGDTADED